MKMYRYEKKVFIEWFYLYFELFANAKHFGFTPSSGRMNFWMKQKDDEVWKILFPFGENSVFNV